MKQKNTRQRSENLVPFFMRMPPALRQEIEQRSKQQHKSQAQVAVELMQRGLGLPESTEFGQWLHRQKRQRT